MVHYNLVTILYSITFHSAMRRNCIRNSSRSILGINIRRVLFSELIREGSLLTLLTNWCQTTISQTIVFEY